LGQRGVSPGTFLFHLGQVATEPFHLLLKRPYQVLHRLLTGPQVRLGELLVPLEALPGQLQERLVVLA